MSLHKVFPVTSADTGEEIQIELHLLDEKDKDRLSLFYLKIPKHEQMDFEINIAVPPSIDDWFKEPVEVERVFIIASYDKNIIGLSSLIKRPGSRMSHVAQMGFYVLPEYRKLGIAQAMLREMLSIALRKDIEKLTVHIPNHTVRFVQPLVDKLGFESEAVLRDQIKNFKGEKEDLHIFSLNIDELWNRISDWQSPYGRAMEH